MTGPSRKGRKSSPPAPDVLSVRPSSTKPHLGATLPLGTPTEEPAPTSGHGIDVEMHDVRTGPAWAANAHRVVEVWTRSRVYVLDSLLLCQEVIDLASGEAQPQHPLLGSRLVGGQIQRDEGAELIFPLPIPGSEAVFQKLDGKQRLKLQLTSKVARVTLHVRRVEVDIARRHDAWNELASTGGIR